MKKFKPFPCGANDAILRVTYYQDGLLEGWFTHPKLDGPRPIKSVPQLLFLLDELLTKEDNLVCYHAFETSGLEAIERVAAIRIQVLFREHYTWQGVVRWEDRNQEVTFRSVLELIQILDEILAE